MPCATRPLTIASPPVIEVIIVVRSLLFVDYAVAKRTDAFGFDLDHVARLEPARRIEAGAGARRRARNDDITGHQRRKGRDVVDEVAEAEDQPRGAILLPEFAIDLRGQADVGDVRFPRLVHEPRPEA